MRVGSAGKKATAYVLASCIGLIVVFSGYFSTTAYADTVTTPFEGDLDNSETFIRPMMPGDIVGANDDHPDYLLANLFYSLTWFYQSDANVWVSGDGNYTREASPMNPAYERNYFVRKFVPSASGNRHQGFRGWNHD